jgi:predicted metalloprotease
VSERRRGLLPGIVSLVVAALLLTSCATVVDGKASVGNAPNSSLSVKGDSGDHFDTVVKNSLSDIIDFWRTEYPKVSGGKELQSLRGGLYSVDGLQVIKTDELPASVQDNACAQKSKSFVIDNGAFCRLDDSISWDRADTHLFAALAKKYGDLVVALIFAHEYGHAISYRLGVFDKPDLKTIDTESQADCAAGAWAASALKGQAAHFRKTSPADLDAALEGYLNGRDSTPDTPQDVSHGNGFDRLSAVADGIDKGATYCFSSGYFSSRTFTERPFTSQKDYESGGNVALAEVLTTSENPFVNDLNRFWTAGAKSIGKTFTPVKIVQAEHPKCGSPPASEFGYCPNDNTVYFNRSFAQAAYYSLPDVEVDKSTGNVKLVANQPADFALGVLFAIGWGMAVRHQLFARSLTDKAALASAVCYTGAYAKDINVAANSGKSFTLSPADLDEATSAMIDKVGQAAAYGARNTTGLDRIQSFVKGYKGGLPVC